MHALKNKRVTKFGGICEELLNFPATRGRGKKPEELGAPVGLDVLEGQTMLMVDDACGLAMAVRKLFMENQISLKEYEGRALSYPVLEKWTQLGIGSTLLPASKVQHQDYARRLHDRSDDIVPLNFQAVWKKPQEARPSFTPMMAGLEPVQATMEY